MDVRTRVQSRWRLCMIYEETCEVVGANPELYGCSDIVDVCGDVEFNACEWGTIEA